MAMHVRDGSSWKTVLAIKAYDGSTWVNGANAAIWDGSSWVGFLDKINISNQNITVVTVSPTNATAFWSLQSTGFVNASTGSPYLWCQNSNNVDLYEVQVTVTGDTVTGPQGAGNWTLLSVDRTWSVTETSVSGGKVATLSVSIRNAITTQVVANATITLTAIEEN